MMLLTWTAAAQESDEPVVRLMYFYDIEVVTPDEEVLYEEDLEPEMALPTGSIIITGSGGEAELLMDPNGTIIRLAEETNFQIVDLAGIGDNTVNKFQMDVGKFRAVAAAVTGDDSYEFGGPASVCGVRGTDFGMDVNPGAGSEEAYVLEGLIDYSKKGPGNALETIKLGKGQMGNAYGVNFAPTEIPAARLAQIQEKMGFKKLSAESVPTKAPEPTATPEPEEGTVPGTATAEPTPEPTGEPAPPAPELPDWLKELLGMEIGSVTIDDQVYGKVVFQPTFKIDKLKTALYLPIIYKKDMFDPADWYRPKGNDEWSFGFDQTEPMDMAADFVSDLALKLKYFQWGEQRDPFWFKMGNLDNFTIGHGLIVDNYANDADFPSIRRVGVNLGVKMEGWGIETLINDLADIRIVGGRIYFEILPPVALGLSIISDINPGGDLPEEEVSIPGNANVPTDAMIGDPMFFNLGLDLDIPIVESDLLSLVGFTDVSALLPYYNKAGEGAYSAINQGADLSSLITPDGSLKNWGASGGVLGNVAFIDYKVALNYYTGTFRPGFYNKGYDRNSSTRAVEAANYSLNPDSSEYVPTLGIYGQGGYTMDKIFSIDIGYLWPLEFAEDGNIVPAQEDALHLSFEIFPITIPIVDTKLAGSVTYDRTYFVPMVMGETVSGGKVLGLIDEFSVLQGEIVYGVSSNLDLVISISGAVSRDAAGNIKYDDNGNQMTDTSFGIETAVHF